MLLSIDFIMNKEFFACIWVFGLKFLISNNFNSIIFSIGWGTLYISFNSSSDNSMLFIMDFKLLFSIKSLIGNIISSFRS